MKTLENQFDMAPEKAMRLMANGKKRRLQPIIYRLNISPGPGGQLRDPMIDVPACTVSPTAT